MTSEELAEQYRILIDKSELPRFLCKYRTIEQTLMFLKNRKLWFAQTKSFNDPFESKYVIRPSFPFNKKDVYDVLDHFYDSIGVLCLCTSWDNILMWTHYGDKHRGAVLVFDVLEDVDLFKGLVPVTYTNNYPIINPLNPKTYLRIMRDKFMGWRHESEFRVLHPDSANTLKEIKPSSLQRIVFGCKTSQESITKVKDYISKNDIYGHVKLYQCRIDSEEYKLNTHDLNR